jgi:hypothetical protein
MLLHLFIDLGCLRLVSKNPPFHGKVKSPNDMVYVNMVPEKFYLQRSRLLVRQAVVDNGYLLGIFEEVDVRIPLDEIASIEIHQFDKRKVVIYSFVFAIVGTFSVLYAKGWAKAFAE